MGRPEADSTDNQPQEYDLQPQEYQYEHATTQSDIEINHYDSSQPPQDYQQPPQQPQFYQQQQYPPAPAQPSQPAQFPSGQTGLNNPAYPPPGPQKPAQYPPQNLNQPAAYPPPPVHFPPPSPQANTTYQGGLNQPPAYPPPQRPPPPNPGQPSPVNYPPHPFPPQGGQQGFSTLNAYQAPQPQAVPFPPQNMASSPYKPAVQTPMQGIPVMTQQVYDQGWTTGLFDCMDDPNNAIITACFPCITFGQIAEIIDNGQTPCATSGLLYGLIAAFIGCPCIMSCSYRTKLRAKYGLMETPAPDWITHCFCEWCALCQEYRELRIRGLDPAIGWQGNLMNQSMQNPQVAMMPPTNQKMMP